MALPLIINGTGEREIGRRVRAALDQVGLLDRERYPPRSLSAGEQQRLGIARAIVSRPKVLIADEPTGNLDPDLSLEVMTLFKRLNEVGTTMVIATHDLHLVEHFGSRQIILTGGSDCMKPARTGSRGMPQNAIGALGTLSRNPVATALTVTVIGIALALPAALGVLVQSGRSLAGGWADVRDFSVYLDPGVGLDRARGPGPRTAQQGWR